MFAEGQTYFDIKVSLAWLIFAYFHRKKEGVAGFRNF
jgi:hypothetical protein